MSNDTKQLPFSRLTTNHKNVCFLQTANKTGKNILAYNPTQKFKGNSIRKFLEFVQKAQAKKQLLIGYISYDLGYRLQNIKQTAQDDLKLPKIYFLAFDKWQEQTKTPSINHTKKSQLQTKKIGFKSEITPPQYQTAYQKIQHHLKEGDIYQINLTHRLKAQTQIPARELFQRITIKNPVEFLAYIEGEDFEVLSASPERFAKISNNQITTEPIKGTRPRGKTSKQDQKFKNDLLNSEKEAAELNMITDLLRNDLGQIAKIGTVKILKSRALKKCPTVWHTYSKITAEIKPDMHPIEALISMLPGGSITGCPKKRAMEIIDQLEPTTRSVYTGIIGYIKPDNQMDFSIAIRTIIKKAENLYLQVGGGIVIDSKPKAEFQETLDKAKSFMEL